jgi:hypothetical protein
MPTYKKSKVPKHKLKRVRNKILTPELMQKLGEKPLNQRIDLKLI